MTEKPDILNAAGDIDFQGIKGPRTDLSRPGSQAHVVHYRSPAR